MNEVQCFQMEEEIAVNACCDAAKKAGYSELHAEECEDGSLECEECPFKRK